MSSSHEFTLIALENFGNSLAGLLPKRIYREINFSESIWDGET
jgi:hypothetical protein